jgi:mannose-6-phosphate isomerase-like protein (cupin superfamily)
MQAHTIRQALGLLERTGKDFTRLIEKADFDIGFYKPERRDPQTPHARDELYVVAAGSGEFFCNGETRAFSQADVLFVPAGVEHRFRDFSTDFAAWVVFFGRRPG